MSDYDLSIDSAFWLAPGLGCILLNDNWNYDFLPPFELENTSLKLNRLRRMPVSDLAYFTCYEILNDEVEFKINPKKHPQIDFQNDPVAVVGSFNNWGDCPDRKMYELDSNAPYSNDALFTKIVSYKRLNLSEKTIEFKFRSKSGFWIKPLSCAPNITKDPMGNLNYNLNPNSNGNHAFLFNLENDRGLDKNLSVSISNSSKKIIPGLSYYDLKSDLPLGSIIENDESTTFRIFAPRASKVYVETQMLLDQTPTRHELKINYDQLTWEVNIKHNLSGFYYNFFIDGLNDGVSTDFTKDPILDPYALATLGPSGPGVIINKRNFPTNNFNHSKSWNDLIILECHVKDLTKSISNQRGDFKNVAKYIKSKNNYIQTLGANAVEFMPIQQFDAEDPLEYHWGYMTTNYFSPCLSYSSRIDKHDQNNEFKEMVYNFHELGKSVIIDVVYNHVGKPEHLSKIDKAYYFHLKENGDFENWSGCGNTIRAESAMAKRLIIDSLKHLIECYDVDGFRFDLAELIGVEVLKEIEIELKKIKPSIILIAEPWSFRGQIKRELRLSGFMFWNDEFREFAHDYVLGNSNLKALDYFIRGSLDYLSGWPCQSINYIESHDDRCWIDKITENKNYQGQNPTDNDIKRTHIAASLLLCSLGTPMISQGLDFLKSKKGKSNTYQNPELNYLDYNKIQDNLDTHYYFKNWIKFRNSKWGELLRLDKIPDDEYIKIFPSTDNKKSSAAIMFNVNNSLSKKKILLVLNPHIEKAKIKLDFKIDDSWKIIADAMHFEFKGIHPIDKIKDQNDLVLNGLSVYLLLKDNSNN